MSSTLNFFTLCTLLSLSTLVTTTTTISSNSNLTSLASLTILTPSLDGTCGGTELYTCTNSSFGNCCSKYGFCGVKSSYCLTSHGCQPSFGACVDMFPNITASMDGLCSEKVTCNGGPWDGACCSAAGFCGYTDEYCLISNGCQRGLGTCHEISMDGTCGAPSDNICVGSTFGVCCSATGHCGDGPQYCGLTCQGQVGPCLSPSVDGTCGWDTGYTCLDSTFGSCCSASGHCGNGTEYCSVAAGCTQDQIGSSSLGNCTMP